MATAPTPGGDPKDTCVKITLNDHTFEFWPAHIPAKLARECRAETGHATGYWVAQADTEVDIDVLAVIVWLARRQAGELITLDEVESDITYETTVSVGKESVEVPEGHPLP